MSDVEAVVAGPPDIALAVDEVDERIPDVRISPAILEALRMLDAIHLPDVFRKRATVMKVPPKFLRGDCPALRLAMNEVRAGRQESNVLKQVRGWKFFLFIPRLLLNRPKRGGLIPRRKLCERFEKFSQGRWFELQIAGGIVAGEPDTSASRRRRRSPVSIVHRVARAETLAHLGELSAARNALEGDPCAPGDNITLRALQDESRRPQHPRFPVPREVLEHRPEVEPALDRDWFLVSLRTARKGAAGGPSGMTAEHLRVLLRNERDSDLLHEMASDVVRADISDEVLEAIRIGRMVALQKLGGV